MCFHQQYKQIYGDDIFIHGRKAKTHHPVEFEVRGIYSWIDIKCVNKKDKINYDTLENNKFSFILPNDDVYITIKRVEIPPKNDNIRWRRSDEWPYGKWYGGDSTATKPDGSVMVIYEKEILYNKDAPSKGYSKRGQKVVGIYANGNLIEGELYDPDDPDKIIEDNFSTTSS